MQRRYLDRGRVFDYLSWRALFGGVFAAGVYRGFDITVNSSGDVVLGAAHSEMVPGLYMLPSGIAVSENASIVLNFSPPGAANYTIRSIHNDNGLIHGINATYSIVDGLLEEQPENGTILGWIRYTGGTLTQSMITPAPKIRSDEIDQTTEARTSIEGSPPRPILRLDVDPITEVQNSPVNAAEVTGAEVPLLGGPTPPLSWHGVQNASTAAGLVTKGYFQWRVLSEPYQIVLVSLLPTGTQLSLEVLDTTGTSIVGPNVYAGHTTFTTTQLLVPQGVGTWTENGTGTVVLTYTTPQATTIKVHRLIVDNWPFAIPRT